MFRLESRILQREFKVHEGTLYASQIRNTLSGMDLVPDGNSVEFLFHFTDGSEFSSKGLTVADAKQENGRLSFTFNECDGMIVTMSFWPGEDGNTLKKQISFIQNNTKVIDYVMLENIGIVNSEAHFSVPVDVEDEELTSHIMSLGQPFYIDSLFFGCEFPATENNIVYGVGQVKYYLGEHVDGEFFCPVTVVGGAKSNNLVDVQKAFHRYIDDIAQKNDIRIQYNSWYDYMLNIDADNVERSFFEVEKNLSKYGIEPIDAYVLDDGWNNYKADFWSFNKKFPNKLYDISQLTEKINSHVGLWLGPRGGYNSQGKFAKRIEKAGLGAYNASSNDICIADKAYINNVKGFLLKATKEFDISYWKLDGFCLHPCTNSKHDHIVGGENDMHYYTELWENWIDIIKSVRKQRKAQGKDLWINMTCYVNPSPWWLQYVNSIWLQNSSDIGFCDNQENQSKLDAEITYRDSRYYNLLCTRACQLPQSYIYNHEPIYGTQAKVSYTDEEFEKYLYFNACRGQALNELHISYSMMNKSKWRILSNVINWQKANFDILRNSKFIGGNPAENNIYGYFCWNNDSDGIIALRNPTDEKTALTLTFNKLMGCPEDMKNVQRYNVFNSSPESFDSYSYGDKLDLTLRPFEIKIIQFGKKDRRFYPEHTDDFTISFIYKGEENITIAENEDISIKINNGKVSVRCDSCELNSDSLINSGEHKLTIVREKNLLLKLYIDKHLDCSSYSKNAKKKINLVIDSNAEEFTVIEKATPYDEIISLKGILRQSGKRIKGTK